MKTQLPTSWARRTSSHAAPLLLALVLAASGLMADQIKTETSTLTLPPLESLKSENSLRQSLRIAEIGVGELRAQTAGLAEEEKALAGEAKAFEKKQKEEHAIVEKLDARFVEARNQYDERLRAYDERKRVHDADALKQQAAAQASNNLAPQRRNASTVSRINDWGQRVDERKARLDQELALVNREREVVESKRQEVLAYDEGATERLKSMHASLEAKIKAYNFKKELAYRQLQQCADYAVQIRKILATKFNVPEVFSPELNGAIEELKKTSGSGIDSR